MGRKAGSKNGGNIFAIERAPIEVTAEEYSSLRDIFTSIDKDLISINDFMTAFGLSYNACATFIREIKAVADTCGRKGYVHRIDYFLYLSRRLKIFGTESNGAAL